MALSYASKRVAPRKLVCAWCKHIQWEHDTVEELRKDLKGEDPDNEWVQELVRLSNELEGVPRPEYKEIRTGELCLYVELSGAHYLHLECAERYIKDLQKALTE